MSAVGVPVSPAAGCQAARADRGRDRRDPQSLGEPGHLLEAAGVLLTFLPLALSAESYQLGAVALLVQSCAAPLAR
ncbi:hypothetical protein [Microbispora bryophytorum]|uniref:hypothetical protein n=1 Tax=Microbispora bryophytorum TaxID=1460882 RepID=UPI0033F7EE73